MAGRTNKPGWGTVKKCLSAKNPRELISLIGDLYSLSEDNREFLHARCSLGDPLEPYKRRIADALYPDPLRNQPVRLSEGRRAISEYKKAVGDPFGVLELMVHYVECGTRFTVEYGDIDEAFYDSLCSMFMKVLEILEESDRRTVEQYLPRLRGIVEKANHVGWGYYDTVSAALAEAFPGKG